MLRRGYCKHMTISQPNPDVDDTGAEVDEFADAPPAPDEDDTDQEDPEASLYSTVPLEDDEGHEYVIQQQNVGKDNMEGGGEWPDPDTPPKPPAPGAVPVSEDEHAESPK